ncbi:PaaI family thioesterase [Streptomyces formicae]|uniref:DUF4442 domain-containing protein n=1 Tax=Streptomyces formicae TaxID=1616117 RepID=A0ABY3WKV8_9ACTN|nr:DUF4442 domain-containing protein [Streptomyces formicae]UNM13258.1 DUF4442 domain-containing protein [Streptomyces formicae]
MDATELARQLLDPIPAHRTARIEVVRAVDGAAQVALETPPELTNVIGSLHSSGLITLVDAAGLAAIIAAAEHPDQFDGVVPLGAAASLRFTAPARGRLLASCRLSHTARAALRSVLAGEENRTTFTTHAEITDAEGTVVCSGHFDWSVRRPA